MNFKFQIADFRLKNLKFEKIFEIAWTVILNLFQDLTPWTKRDAESREARDMTTIGFKKLEENLCQLLCRKKGGKDG